MSIKPKFSLLCPTYNHEKYIKDFIDSVLAQTVDDFELIIVDDCSKDDTLEIAKSYKDKRIKTFTKKYNKGLNDSMNLAFGKAKGEYCVFIASDDMLKEDYLETILNIFETNKNIGIIYNSLEVMDLEGKTLKEQPTWAILQDSSRYELLNRLFMIWNVLLSPGMAIRYDTLKKIMPLDISFVNHQDYAMHVALLLDSEPYLLKTPKVRYRYDSKGESLSSRNNVVELREKLEMPRLMNNFLKIKDIELLKNIFEEDKEEFKTKELIPFYLGKEALKSKNYEKSLWGYNTIMEFVSKDKNYELLNKELDFTFASYLKLISPTNTKTEDKYFKKYKKYKKISKILSFIALIAGAIALYFIIRGI